jgi:hypothetical protein
MSSSNRPKTQAISLLEGILQETKGEAEAEMQRLSEEVRLREEQVRIEAEFADAAKREEANRRLAEEEARQVAAASRRQAELERMRIEELKAKGLWKEPERPVEVEVAPAPAASSRPAMSTVDAIAVQKAQAKQSRSTLLMAAAAFVAIAAAVGGGLYATSIEYVDATTQYGKAEPEVVAVADAVAALTLQAIPEPPAPLVEEPAAADGPSRSNSRTRRPAAEPAAENEGRPIRLDRTRQVF